MLKVFFVKIGRLKNNLHSSGIKKAMVNLHNKAGRSLLKYGLYELFGIEFSEEMLMKNAHGKPYLKDHKHIFFNISHSGEMVVCVFSNKEVGVDIEKIRKMPDQVAVRYFHPNELKVLESCDDKDQCFFTIWAIKESYLKYLGTGLNRGLTSFEVVNESEAFRVKDGSELIDIVVLDYQFAPGYSCAVCSLEPEFPEVREIDPNALSI